MVGVILMIIFVVTFYYAFKTIWKNVKTVSYSGLSGFFSSWLSQLIWAGFIAGVVTTIAAKILESIMDFGSSIDFGTIFEWGIVAVVICAIFFHEEDTFDRKTFRENYNRNVAELNQQVNLSDDILFFLSKENPGNLVALAENNTGAADLSLPEEFITSKERIKLTTFPSMSIIRTGTDKPHINLSLVHTDCDYEMGRAAIALMEKRITELAFTAAIEAIAKGKSREIENALDLINEHGAFGFLSYGETDKREYFSEGVRYKVSTDNGNVSLSITKIPSGGK